MDLFDVGSVRASIPPYVRIEYEGQPQAWERAGATVMTARHSGRSFIKFYTPKKTARYERALKQMAVLAMRKKKLLTGAVAIRVTATMRVPKSWTNKDRDAALAGALFHTSTPDVDNLMKVIDAFKKVVWSDDACVVRALVAKIYGERPALLVEVYEM